MYSAHIETITYPDSTKSWLIFGLAITIAFATLVFMQLETKWAVFTIVALALPFLAFVYRDTKRFYLGALIFAIPLNADVQFLIHPSAGGADSISITATDILLFILLGYWIYESATRKHNMTPRIFPEITLPTLLLIVASIISLVQAKDVLKGVFDIIQHFKVLVFFIVLANLMRTKKDIQFVIGVFLIGVLIQAVIMSLQFYKGSNIGLLGLGEPDTILGFEMETSDVPRPGGTIGHCNHISRYVGLVLPVTMILAYIKTNSRMMRLAVITSLAGILILIQSLSRSAWLGLGVSILTIAPLVLYRRLMSPRFLRNALVSVFMIIAVLFCFKDTIVGRLTSPDLGSSRTRITTAKVARHIIHDHPFIGVGMNNYGEVLNKYWDPQDRFTRKAAVHNTYLLYAAEIGLLGLITYLILLMSLFDQIRRATHAKDKFLAAVAVGFAGGFAGMLIMALTDKSYKENFPLMMLFWGMAAIIVAINKIEAKKFYLFPKLAGYK